MSIQSLILTLAILISVGAPAVFGQALSGTYTCANGNPGGAFDYADIGDFFDDLENFGLSAHVVLELYDDGGDFTSKESYQLGLDGSDLMYPILRPVAGISVANTLTIRAGPGQSPTISGGGATAVYPAGGYLAGGILSRGAMSFTGIGHTTIEGLDIRNAHFGISWYSYGSYSVSNIRVIRCRFHNLTQGSAIGTVASAGEPFHGLTIRGNMFWNCDGPGAGQGGWGVISVKGGGALCAIRDNTVLLVKPVPGPYSAVFFDGQEVLSDFSGNIVYMNHASTVSAYNAWAPLQADNNILHVAGAGKLFNGTADWAWWQGQGLDPNGLNTDPLLVSVAPGSEDLRLRPDSPAIDLIPSGGPATDVFGNPRPYGLGFDAGAHELQNFGARAGLAAGSALVGPSGGPYSISLNHGDALADVAIELSDFEGDDITVSAITPSAALAGVVAPAIPAPRQPLTLAWTGFIDDTNPPGTYTWTVEFADAGTGFVMTCEVSITVTTPPPVALHTPSPLPPGRVGQPYSLALQATGTGTLVFSLLAGDLPPGLQLSTTGHITGTPTQDGQHTFTVQAADNFTTTQQAYEIRIKPKPPTSTDSGSCSAGHTSHTAWLILIALATLAVRRATGSRQTAGRKH